MSTNIRFRKKIAVILLFIIGIEIFQPLSSYALTSGPTQPESASFQPISVSDMVDLSSGDFHYSIPLMDVDGYPINLSYQGGVGMDDEASWTGLGWNVNVGAINRQLRGVPDDFLGDETTVEHYTKPKITLGAKVNVKVEVKGIPLNPNLSLSMGVFNDNYTGIGAEIGANAGVSLSIVSDGLLTAGMGLGVLSSTSSGAEITPSMSLSVNNKIADNLTGQAGLTASLGFNTRSGMKDLTLGSSFGISGNLEDIQSARDAKFKEEKITKNVELENQDVAGGSYQAIGSSISFNTEPINASISVPYISYYDSFSLELGASPPLVFLGGGATGYRSRREVIKQINKKKTYGFLYAERGKNNKDAVMDFTREKDNPAVPDMPNLAIPISTYDLFSFTNQFGSGQFRLHRGGTGAFFDNETQDKSNVETFGADFGFGGFFHGGISHFDQNTVNKSNKWVSGNAYLAKADFQDYNPLNAAKEQAYFKIVGEKTAQQNDFFSHQQTEPLAVTLSNENTLANFSNGAAIPVNSTIRHYRKTDISYLTAGEAQKLGTDNKLVTYPFLSGTFNPNTTSAFSNPEIRDRVNNLAKAHHISAIKVTDESGKKMVYGLPVYNTLQSDYTFAIGNGNAYGLKKNQVKLQSSNFILKNKGVDNYYHSEKQAPYASSFLLTQILSSDYIDVKNDGITDDDLGTAIKFNYSKIANYKWRTPYPYEIDPTTANNQPYNATLNRALLADDEDDKANVVYGEKELCYVQSIETKNKIAYFITEDREDGLGVLSWIGGRDVTTKQKRLKEIRLYSKHDLSKPIKTVVLNYDYSLCQGTPNSIATTHGKLTLTSVYFKYGNTTKGSEYPYKFEYNNAEFALRSTDRWGVYKPEDQNLNGLTNEEFPYTTQNKISADENVKAWNLSQITLPSGGKIGITYESDSYSYVQDKKASTMFMITALVNSGGIVNDMKTARGVRVILKEPVPTEKRGISDIQWFKDTFLNGGDNLYSKLSINFATSNYNSTPIYDFVSSYQKVSDAKFSNDGSYVDIFFPEEEQAGVKAFPISFAAWQKLKNEYPKFAFPGYKNKVRNNQGAQGLKAAVTALANSFKTLSELTENFFKKSGRKSYANQVDLNKSFVRLVPQSGVKLGGGYRVKEITISDEWNSMSDGIGASYGQRYEYSVDNDPNHSSGVASYEPAVGNDENSLKQPIKYMQKVKGGRGINNLFELEEPFGESLYPAPSVVYSRVKVIPLDRSGEPAPSKMGYSTEEYYTAKEFPVRVKSTDINQYRYNPKKVSSFFKASSVEYLVLSQGYRVVVNDMHGKLKSKASFNGGDIELTSSIYEYGADAVGDGTFDLNNNFKIIKPDGSITEDWIGTDSEFYSDFRENVSNNQGRSITLGVDVIPFIWGALPIPHKPSNGNSEYKLFRSACNLQLVQNFGVVKAIVNKQDGANIRTENLAFDQTTSEAVLTRTQNEFEDYIYSFTMPAYWAYPGMGGAYQNSNIVFNCLVDDSNKIVNYGLPINYLQEGDQLMDVNLSNTRYWVINNHSGGKSLINDKGQIIGASFRKVKIVQTGFKNDLSSKTYSFTARENPLTNNGNFFTNLSSQNLKVMNASAQTYDQDWVADVDCVETKTFEDLDFMFHKPYISEYYQATSHGTGGIGIPNTSVYEYYGENMQNVIQTATSWDYNSNNNNILFKRLLSKGIWLNSPIENHLNEFLGFTESITIPETKTYIIGCAGDNEMKFKLIKSDGSVREFHLYPGVGDYAKYWHLFPVQLEVGEYKVDVVAINYAFGSDVPYPNNEIHNPGIVGLEVYNNTINLYNGTETPNVIFSTESLADNPAINSFRTIDGKRVYNHDRTTLNPFIAGMLGNWRPYQSYSYLIDREDLKTGNTSIQRNSGFLKEFTPFWQRNSALSNLVILNNDSKWRLTNTVTQYDRYGQELENLNPLNKYSAALFAFKGELPAAVASNARNREIYYDSFEDLNYKLNHPTAVCNPDYQKPILNQNNLITNAHSGKYAYLIENSATPFEIGNGIIHQSESKSGKYYEFNNKGEYSLKKDRTVYPNGFEPTLRKYHVSLWVKDYYGGIDLFEQNKDVNLKGELTVNGTTQDVILKFKTSVEGWKLLEGDFNVAATGAYSLKLRPQNLKSSLIDDIRIFPIDAQLKSYAYNNQTFKLMAEMDENNFATFYEYDDEGTLARVKKETERGIVTLKESRSSYRKSN